MTRRPLRAPRASLYAMMASCLFVSSSLAATPRYIEFSTGTGFFVSHNGDLVTNHHVIQNCKTGAIEVRNDKMGWTPASVRSSDKTNDLALLRVNKYSPAVAPLEANEGSIRKNDSVIVIGYPGEHSRTGKYKFVKSSIVDVKGPQGEPKWVQFTDVVVQGNSGGPLLDQSGNVIGVVTGRAELYKVNMSNKAQEFMGSTGVAVSLPLLKEFLYKNRVHYPRKAGWADRHDSFVERRARDFIANVRCVMK